jgi:hypothetical protein
MTSDSGAKISLTGINLKAYKNRKIGKKTKNIDSGTENALQATRL